MAQVTSDTTVNTSVSQNGIIAEITGGETRGDNLFHSFQDFSVPAGNEAFFNNANDISNIFSRVTGGNISSIEGVIRANGSASLFLINPAGIIFGEGARLDIGGSFYGTTASSILFEDGDFSATDLDTPPLLTVNAPIGLNFRDNPGDITLNPDSILTVDSSQTLALVGGNISFNNAIAARGNATEPGSTIVIGGLTKAGTVVIEEDGSLSFPNDIARGDVSIVNSFLDVTAAGEGEIFIYAKNFELTSGSFIFNNVLTDSESLDNFRAGDTIINATDDVLLEESNIVSNVIGGRGEAGDIEISGRNISLVDGGLIGSSILFDGNSSNITVTAAEKFFLSGIFSGIDNNVIQGSGIVGEINVAARNLVIENGAIIQNEIFGVGDNGDININVIDTITIDSEDNFLSASRIQNTIGAGGEGNPGNINIQTKDLSIINGGRVNSGIDGLGIGGDVNITAENVSVDGDLSSILSEATGTISNVIDGEDTTSSGGNINIETNTLSITNGGKLATSTTSIGNAGNIKITAKDQLLVDGTEEGFFGNPSIINSDVELAALSDVVGNSGNVEINTSKLIVTNEGIISASTLADGNAGNLTIRTSEFLKVGSNAFIQADVFFTATGTGGNLNIETPNLTVSDGGVISASTFGNGNAGNLTIHASDSINITGESDTTKSGLFATALNLNGKGGELNIFTQDLTVSDGAIISVGNLPNANSSREVGTGEPGNLNIQANLIDLKSGGSIAAATQSSVGEGANITLEVADKIILQDGGLISAQAINEGNGGNLSIDTNFIIAFPNGNSDIIASAEQGQGGNITINAESLFGIEERPLSDLTNDINASSEFSLDGSITINTPDINPIQGTVELPSNIVVPEQTAAQACRANREIAAQNGFTIKGKGGVPAAPELPLASQNVYVEGESETISSANIPEAVETSVGKIQPARGIKVTRSGIVLTAYRTNNAGDRLPEIKLNCGS
ncbi:MAG: filamentous hemagglutinin N-terminal domain-containing protein [Cyanobacteria bacterium P01_A01_bin.40]